MKAIILAGGFATRLFPLTKHIPKALLPVDGKPIIDFLLEKIQEEEEIDEIIISINARFKNHFLYWKRCVSHNSPGTISIVTEPTTKEEEKLGAVGGLNYVIERKGLEGEELFVAAGDNLFEFRLADFVAFYREHGNNPVIAFCDLQSEDRVRGKYGVGILDENSKVVDFQEKSHRPKSTLASTCCYLYPAWTTRLIKEYLEDPGQDRDAPGYFMDWLRQKTEVYGFAFQEAWYDIGSFSTYDQVNEDYKGKVVIQYE